MEHIGSLQKASHTVVLTGPEHSDKLTIANIIVGAPIFPMSIDKPEMVLSAFRPPSCSSNAKYTIKEMEIDESGGWVAKHVLSDGLTLQEVSGELSSILSPFRLFLRNCALEISGPFPSLDGGVRIIDIPGIGMDTSDSQAKLINDFILHCATTVIFTYHAHLPQETELLALHLLKPSLWERKSPSCDLVFLNASLSLELLDNSLGQKLSAKYLSGLSNDQQAQLKLVKAVKTCFENGAQFLSIDPIALRLDRENGLPSYLEALVKRLRPILNDEEEGMRVKFENIFSAFLPKCATSPTATPAPSNKHDDKELISLTKHRGSGKKLPPIQNNRVARIKYPAEFIKSIAIWIGGFSLVGVSVDAAAPNDIGNLLLFAGFACFMLALASSIASASMAQGAWDEDVADTDTKIQCLIRAVLFFSVAFCFAGLLCVFAAFTAFFLSKTTPAGFKIATWVIMCLAFALIVLVFVTGAVLSGKWEKATTYRPEYQPVPSSSDDDLPTSSTDQLHVQRIPFERLSMTRT